MSQSNMVENISLGLNYVISKCGNTTCRTKSEYQNQASVGLLYLY